MKRPLDMASSGHRAQNQLAMNDPPPVLIDLHSASSRRESQNAFRRRKKGTVATRPHSSALGRTSGPASALKLGRRGYADDGHGQDDRGDDVAERGQREETSDVQNENCWSGCYFGRRDSR